MSDETPTDGIDYQSLMKGALRGVVRDVLLRVADEGMSGEHHFYIGFRTSDDGIVMPRHLQTRYPKEMTIVMQHQFWGLDVDESAFSVTLRFGGRPCRLTIPYAAMTSFVDPAVPFGLRFDFEELGDETADRPREAGNVEEPDARESDAGEVDIDISPPLPTAGVEAIDTPRPQGELVSLDEFRKRD